MARHTLYDTYLTMGDASDGLFDKARRASYWIADRAIDAGGWLVLKAKGLWRWTGNHPILATALVAGIIAAAAFPVIAPALVALPYVGPVVAFLIASAPSWAAAPIAVALTVAAAAASATVTFLVVKLFKKLFGDGSSPSDGAAFSFDDSLEDDAEYVEDNKLGKSSSKQITAAVKPDVKEILDLELDKSANEFNIVPHDAQLQRPHSPNAHAFFKSVSQAALNNNSSAVDQVVNEQNAGSGQSYSSYV